MITTFRGSIDRTNKEFIVRADSITLALDKVETLFLDVLNNLVDYQIELEGDLMMERAAARRRLIKLTPMNVYNDIIIL